MRVAIVCYYAPPLRSAASHRVLRMTRALLRAGHEVHWVAADPDRMRDPHRSLDESLRTLIPQEVIQHRMGGSFGWTLVLRRRLPRLLEKHRIGAVVLCCPSSQIGLIPKLRRKLVGLRIFVDYLELPVGSVTLQHQARFLRRANAVFVPSASARREFLRTVGKNGLPVEVMRNAADYGMADAIERRILAPDLGEGVHLGVFGKLSPYRRLLPFLKALESLSPEQLEQISLHVYTEIGDVMAILEEDLLAVNEGVAARVVRHEDLPFAQALRSMQVMDALLMVGGQDGDEVLVPEELYDYLMARRPVLFVGGPGEAAEIVKRACGPKSLFPAEEPEPLAKAIAQMIENRPPDKEPIPACRPMAVCRSLLTRLEPRGLD